MKVILLLFVCVALVSYYGAQGDEETDKKEDVEDNEEEGRRQFISPYAGGLSAAQAAANAQAAGFRPPTPPRPTSHRPIPAPVGGCYSCVDCPDTKKLTSQHFCTTHNQRCVSFVEKYKHRKQLLYVRGCVSERGTCEDIRRAHKDRSDVKLVSCEECNGDRCNSNGVARSLPDLTAALFFVVVTPLITKYALS